jgi:hypothetical protein
MREDDAQVAEEDMDLGSPYPVWQSSATLPNFDDPQMIWQWRWCGFGSCDYKDKDTSKHSFLFIPYWSITIPLALLSAYLILCKSPNRADN